MTARLSDIAAQAQVSEATVSRVLNDKPGVAPEKRAGLAEVLRRLSAGEAGVLIVAKGDRLSRSLGDLCNVMNASAREGWDLVCLDLAVDTTTPMGRAMAQIAGVFAELERALISQRIRDALAVRKAQGLVLGRPQVVDPATRALIGSLRAEGLTMAAIADYLRDTGVPTARGGTWAPGTVNTVLRSLEDVA